MLGRAPAGCCAVQQQATLSSPAGEGFASWLSFFMEEREAGAQSSGWALSRPSPCYAVRTHPQRTEMPTPSAVPGSRGPVRLQHVPSTSSTRTRGELAASTRVTYTGARLRLEPRQQAAWEEQAFIAASSRLQWSADLFSSCRLSSGSPQGQGWSAASGSPGAFSDLGQAGLQPAHVRDAASQDTSCHHTLKRWG